MRQILPCVLNIFAQILSIRSNFINFDIFGRKKNYCISHMYFSRGTTQNDLGYICMYFSRVVFLTICCIVSPVIFNVSRGISTSDLDSYLISPSSVDTTLPFLPVISATFSGPPRSSISWSRVLGGSLSPEESTGRLRPTYAYSRGTKLRTDRIWNSFFLSISIILCS